MKNNMQPFTIKLKDRPKWYQFRTRLANVFIKIARWIKPGNPEMMAYLTEQMVEMELSGMAIRKVDWKEFYKEDDGLDVNGKCKHWKQTKYGAISSINNGECCVCGEKIIGRKYENYRL